MFYISREECFAHSEGLYVIFHVLVKPKLFSAKGWRDIQSPALLIDLYQIGPMPRFGVMDFMLQWTFGPLCDILHDYCAS